jgi:hypothetical protein
LKFAILAGSGFEENKQKRPLSNAKKRFQTPKNSFETILNALKSVQIVSKQTSPNKNIT